MADLVGVVGVTHNPLMWSLLRQETPPDLAEAGGHLERLRGRVAALAPDVIVLVASDHLHFLFTFNMPAFLIGKAETMRATFPNETRSFGIPALLVPGDRDLAAHLLGGGDLTAGHDFAFSDEPWLDHSFVVPLLSLTPGLDVPVVPVFTNANSPPIPTSARFARLGAYLGEAIRSWPEEKRVLVVGSGHLAHELGGPRQFLGASPDPGFDVDAVAWMRDGDLEAAVSGTGFDRLTAAGNETHQFLNFVTCLALAARPADLAEGTPTRFGNLPFLYWETR